MSRLVAIIGRPNVGKSTFFNRLVGGRKAIVDEQSGVTRDRHYGVVEWLDQSFNLVDTGGYDESSKELFDVEIKKQVVQALQEAELVLFMVDTRVGITDLDEEVARLIRRSNKKVLLVANKIDTFDLIPSAQEFYSFGFGEIFPISSMTGSGTGELLDKVLELLPKDDKTVFESDLPKLAIVGRPNAGKSSLVNTLLGFERNIVTPIAGTTRDTIHSHYNAFEKEFILVDTAGIRKKGKVSEDLEFYSVMRAINAIETADVCILMIDAVEGIGAQDLNIFHLIDKNRKGVVILINKWDLVEKDHMTMKAYEAGIRKRLEPFTDVDIIFTSVITKQRIHKAIETALEVHQNRIQRIKTRLLNDIMLPIVENNPPPATKGKYIKIKFVQQLPTHAPTFVYYCNLPQYIKEPYKRFIENKMRQHFQLRGVPIQIFFRKK